MTGMLLRSRGLNFCSWMFYPPFFSSALTHSHWRSQSEVWANIKMRSKQLSPKYESILSWEKNWLKMDFYRVLFTSRIFIQRFVLTMENTSLMDIFNGSRPGMFGAETKTMIQVFLPKI